MLHQDEQQDDDEGEEEAKEQPDVDHLHVGRGGQLGGDGVVEGVHDQHTGQGHRDARLEVLFLKVCSCLWIRLKWHFHELILP